MIADLGSSISSTLQNLFKNPVTDEAIELSLKEVCTSLVKANVSPILVSKLRSEIKERISKEKIDKTANKAKVVNKAFYDSLVNFLDPGVAGYEIKKGKSNVVVFVGLQGCGKTTSICKYANFYKKLGFKTGIVCADTFRAGAFDQVKQNASKIGIPFFGSSNPDPVQVAREGVAKFRKSDFDLILVDTSGRHTQEDALFSEMKDLVDAVTPDNIVFVMDAGIGQSAQDQAIGFKNAVKVGGIILTKIDGASKAGGALSSVAATHSPIEFVGTGEGMEDLEKFNPGKFVSKMLGMADIDGFIEKISSLDFDPNDVVDKLSTGKFRLLDFKNLFGQIMSLKILEMIPGLMKGMQMPDEQEVNKIMYIFDSMDRKELESNGDILLNSNSRISRIARGSGTSRDLILDTISKFKQMSSMMKKMMGNPMFSQLLSGGGLNEKDKKKINSQANGNPLLKQFSSMMDQMN